MVGLFNVNETIINNVKKADFIRLFLNLSFHFGLI
jgi:hypothetical protein